MNYVIPTERRNLPFIFTCLISIIFFLFCFQIVSGQYENRFRVMFYNVENLFDTEIDSTINKENYVAGGQLRWSEFRLKKKLSNIFKVIAAVGEGSLPEIIGFCEVENRNVLEMLINQTPLRNHEYEIIHKDSRDRRGIDVAMIYRKDRYWHLEEQFIVVKFSKSDHFTRDILYSKGLLPNRDTIHIFINHWPSKFGGAMASQPLRIDAARTLRNITDSIQNIDPQALILITGDFNANPNEEPIVETLGAAFYNNSDKSKLINLTTAIYPSKYPGTLKYQGNWDCIDQFIVSKSLLNATKGKSKTSKDLIHIGYFDFLLEDDEKYLGKKPFRTYVGFRYIGGYSDHLPIYLDIMMME